MGTNPTINYNKILENVREDRKNDFNVIDKYKSLDTSDLAKLYLAESKPYAVCCLNILGNLNIGTILRTASMFSTRNFIVLGRQKFDKRSSVGMDKYIPIERIEAMIPNTTEIDVNTFITVFMEHKYIPVFAEHGGTDVTQINWKKTIDKFPDNWLPCFVFGNESFGISKEFINEVKQKIPDTCIITIPQGGVCRSFNVSCAASIILWEFFKNN